MHCARVGRIGLSSERSPTMHPRAHVVRFACVVATVLVGCAASNPPPPRAAKKAAPAKVELTSAQAPAPRTPKEPTAQVVIAPDIREICHIEDVETAPKFDFDRSDLTLEVRHPLQQLAECLTTGPLKGQRVLLTGRADPRGEDEYNMSLGSSRAASVG